MFLEFIGKLFLRHGCPRDGVAMPHRCSDCECASIVVTDFIKYGAITRDVGKLAVVSAIARIDNAVEFDNDRLGNVGEVDVRPEIRAKARGKRFAVYNVAVRTKDG